MHGVKQIMRFPGKGFCSNEFLTDFICRRWHLMRKKWLTFGSMSPADKREVRRPRQGPYARRQGPE